MIALYFISISPLLWWGLARALCSSTYRGLKVRQDDREREAPLMRSTSGFWPPKIYRRQVLLKKSHHEREKLHSFIPQVCVFFNPACCCCWTDSFSTLLTFPCVPLQWCESPSSDVAPFPSPKFRCCFTLWLARSKQQKKSLCSL